MENNPAVWRREQSSPRLPWRVLLDEPLRTRAQEAALYVGRQMRNPGTVEQIAQLARSQSLYPGGWSLSQPTLAAQLALFYDTLERCFPQQGWETPRQEYVRLLASASQQQPLVSPSLFYGTAGILFVLSKLSAGGTRYQQTLARLQHALWEQIQQTRWQPGAEKVANSDFELIGGAAGILGVLTSLPDPLEITLSTIRTLLDYLLWLTEPGQLAGQERWFCPADLLIGEQQRQTFPQGQFNCGLSHGIPGPLAALALTEHAGYEVPGLHAALAFVSDWLLERQISDTWGVNWPAAIPFEVATSPAQWPTLPGARTAWCYGTPGVARSLFLAGKALADDHLCQVALDALLAALRRPVSARSIDSPTLCHGVAGLLQICLRFANETRDTTLAEQIPLLVEQILENFDEQSPLGFRDRERQDVLVDQPDWLTGAPGTAMVLLSAACPVEPDWDRYLLVS